MRVAFARPPTNKLGIPCALLLVIAIGACSRPAPQQQTPERASSSTAAAPADDPAGSLDENAPPAYMSEIPEEMRSLLHESFSGDFDEMVKRRMIRVGVTFNRTFYFVDKGVQRGVSVRVLGSLFEDELNKRPQTGSLKIHVVLIPLPRGDLLSALIEGRVDVVAAQLTVRPERQRAGGLHKSHADQRQRSRRDRPRFDPPIASVDDLSGKDRLRPQGVQYYYESLVHSNARFKAKGKPPVIIEEAPDNLEDDDLLEMVNAGLIPTTVVDRLPGGLLEAGLHGPDVHDTAPCAPAARWPSPIRKNSPQLAAALNELHRQEWPGSAFGNMINKRYLESTKFVEERDLGGRAQEVPGDGRRSSASTATSTSSTTC